MENVILIVLLLLAVTLIGLVLLQRSEGGGLGMGGGGGGGVQARGQGNIMTRMTWIFGAAFMAAALALTIYSAQQASTSSVVDGLPTAAETDDATLPDLGESLLPPSGDEPLLPVAE